jgi:hypothetical protein
VRKGPVIQVLPLLLLLLLLLALLQKSFAVGSVGSLPLLHTSGTILASVWVTVCKSRSRWSKGVPGGWAAGVLGGPAQRLEVWLKVATLKRCRQQGSLSTS